MVACSSAEANSYRGARSHGRMPLSSAETATATGLWSISHGAGTDGYAGAIPLSFTQVAMA